MRSEEFSFTTTPNSYLLTPHWRKHFSAILRDGAQFQVLHILKEASSHV